MGGHPKWQRILDMGGDPGGKGSPAVGAVGSREEGGGSEKAGPGLHRVMADSKNREAIPKTCVAESGFRPVPTPRAYRGEYVTGQDHAMG